MIALIGEHSQTLMAAFSTLPEFISAKGALFFPKSGHHSWPLEELCEQKEHGIKPLLSSEFQECHAPELKFSRVCGVDHKNNCLKIMSNSIPDVKLFKTLHTSKAQETRVFSFATINKGNRLEHICTYFLFWRFITSWGLWLIA